MDISKKIKNMIFTDSDVMTIPVPCIVRKQKAHNLVPPGRDAVAQMYNSRHVYKTYNIAVDSRPTGNHKSHQM